jgi:hypothetical protein
MLIPHSEQADKFTWNSFTVVKPKQHLSYRDHLEALLLDFNPDQPRDESGRWAGGVASRMAVLKAKYPVVAQNYAKHSGTEMGSIEAHTGDVAREWETQLTPEHLSDISTRFGSDVQRLMESAIPLHDIGKPAALARGDKHLQHAHTVPILQDVLRKEGFREKDIALATELLNHDKLGALMQRHGRDTAEVVAEKLDAKAQKVGMSTKDFATLQMAFFNADAAAYPFVQHYMEQEPSGKWTFERAKQLAPIAALIHSTRHLSTYDVPAFTLDWDEGQHPRDDKGQFASGAVAIPAGAQGECFRNAASWVRQHDEFDLVHGTVTNGAGRTFDHAWAETPHEVADPTTGVRMDKRQWYGLVHAQPKVKYSAEHAALNMLRTGNLGPWTPEEVRERHLRHDLGNERSGNYGHAGRPGEVGGSAKTEGTQGLKFRELTEDERDEFAVMAAAKVGEKKDGGKVVVNTNVKGTASPAVVTAKVFGKRDPADVAGQILEDMPGNVRVSWQEVPSNGKDIPIGATAVRMYARGEVLGVGSDIMLTRTFTRLSNGELHVHHDVFELPKKLQGKDVAKAVLADSYQTYRELGVDRVDTLANLDRGAYAWAKFGFKAERPTSLADLLRERVTGRPATERRGSRAPTVEGLTPSQQTNLLAIIDTHKNDPKLPWHVANAVTSEGRMVGKELLYDATWFATLDMHDRESTAKLEAYVKGH